MSVAADRAATASTSDTVQGILNAALASLARFGPNRLSVSEICAEANVSRGTFYRYFSGKEEILERLGEHMEHSFEAAVHAALSEPHDIEDRVRIVVNVILTMRSERPPAGRMLDVEPAFALGFLRREFPRFLGVTERALSPALEASPVVRAGLMTAHQAAELVLRVAMSTYLLPSVGAQDVAISLDALWRAQLDPVGC
jgi:AcrR family transcriptional regulator